MKNVYIYLTLLLLISIKGFGQSDVIIWVDNSWSISQTEFAEMKSSIQEIISNVLSCNENRVAVVHYAATYDPGTEIYTPKIFIETDFITDETTANSFDRHDELGNSDFAHESLGLIGKALDNVLDTNIISPQKTLNRINTNSLVIYLFTDAGRHSPPDGSSFLVNATSPTLNTDLAFKNYTDFKNERNANFVVTLGPTFDPLFRNVTIQASAAIASTGGTYTGIVESYPADPDGPGVTGRYLIFTDYFDLTTGQIDSITGFICAIAEDCPPYLTLISTTHDVTSGIDNRQVGINITASNDISSGAEANYLAGESVYLGDGFYAVNGSLLLAKINECESSSGSGSRRAAPQNDTGQELAFKKEALSLSPNPATQNVTLTSDENIKTVSVISLEGKTIFYKELSGKDATYQLDLNNYKAGIYFVTVTAINGTTTTERLIIQ